MHSCFCLLNSNMNYFIFSFLSLSQCGLTLVETVPPQSSFILMAATWHAPSLSEGFLGPVILASYFYIFLPPHTSGSVCWVYKPMHATMRNRCCFIRLLEVWSKTSHSRLQNDNNSMTPGPSSACQATQGHFTQPDVPLAIFISISAELKVLQWSFYPSTAPSAGVSHSHKCSIVLSLAWNFSRYRLTVAVRTDDRWSHALVLDRNNTGKVMKYLQNTVLSVSCLKACHAPVAPALIHLSFPSLPQSFKRFI